MIVGAGPNGLAAAVEIARAGRSVLVCEAASEIGGGTRSGSLWRDDVIVDHCSAVHPMGVLSPLFRELPLADHGLEWIYPLASVAHPLDGGRAAVLRRSLDETGETLGDDAGAWRDLVAPFVTDPESMFADLLAPLKIPRRPLRMLRFGWRGLRSAVSLARGRFAGTEARALFAGLAAHSILPLERRLSAAVGLVFAIAGHAVDWPVARGGSGGIAAALASLLRELGGEIECDRPIASLDELPDSKVIVFDTSPAQVIDIAGDQLPERYRRKLERYRYGPGAFKVDYLLSAPIPWSAPACAEASTVHVGGDLDEIAASEAAMFAGEISERPFLIVCQQSCFDDSRAPAGLHTGYAYCHVPAGCEVDMTARIEAQIERFAPGFGDVVLERRATSPADLEAYNRNNVGGAITGGVADLGQLFARPAGWLRPYSTPNPKLFLCSASTPPGGGVHGMCGFHAARAALRRL